MVTEASERPVIDRIRVLVEQHIDGDLSTAALAASLGFSERHLQRLFKATTGEPLAKYVRRRRMEKAASLLAETDATVISVAERVGYASHSGFTRAFSSYFSVAPSNHAGVLGELKQIVSSAWTGKVYYGPGFGTSLEIGSASTGRDIHARPGSWRHSVHGSVRSEAVGGTGTRRYGVPPWKPLRARASGSRPHSWR